MTVKTSAQTNFQMRRPVLEDAFSIIALFNAASEVFGGGVSYSTADLLATWQGIDLTQNAWVVTYDGQKIVGYEELNLYPEKGLFEIDGGVHPDFLGQGVGSWLVDTVEARLEALLPELQISARPRIQVQFSSQDADAVALFTDRGYERYKEDLVMEIRLTELPLVPPAPSGFSIRPFVPGKDDHPVFDVVNRAFQSIAGYSERAVQFEDWHRFSVQRTGFDPGLWFLAVTAEDEIAGVCLCPHDKEVGWVRQIAVLPEYRGRKLGEYLLQHAFHEWYQRGYTTVQLAVQGDNLAARRVYESVGMTIASEYCTYVKYLG